MSMAMALPGNSDSTFLTHLLARGLEDERYVVERFQAMADGDIRRLPGDAAPAKGRRNAKRTIATVKAVKEMRPSLAPLARALPRPSSRVEPVGRIHVHTGITLADSP